MYLHSSYESRRDKARSVSTVGEHDSHGISSPKVWREVRGRRSDIQSTSSGIASKASDTIGENSVRPTIDVHEGSDAGVSRSQFGRIKIQTNRRSGYIIPQQNHDGRC